MEDNSLLLDIDDKSKAMTVDLQNMSDEEKNALILQLLSKK